jgi:hypothetical protein
MDGIIGDVFDFAIHAQNVEDLKLIIQTMAIGRNVQTNIFSVAKFLD